MQDKLILMNKSANITTFETIIKNFYEILINEIRSVNFLNKEKFN